MIYIVIINVWSLYAKPSMKTPTIKQVILRIAIIIAAVELFIMLLLGGVSHKMGLYVETFVDVFVLILLSTPMILFWVIKPYIVARNLAVTEATHMAMHDPLTQLANRRLLEEHLDKVISTLFRQKRYGALILLDLDNFKPINDAEGHAVGDEILIETACRLLSIVRMEDVAARAGGDEFVIVLSYLDTNKQLAQQKAEQKASSLLHLIKKPIEFKGKNFQISASMGICMLGAEKWDMNTILSHADKAMYQSKLAGKGCITVFEES